MPKLQMIRLILGVTLLTMVYLDSAWWWIPAIPWALLCSVGLILSILIVPAIAYGVMAVNADWVSDEFLAFIVVSTPTALSMITSETMNRKRHSQGAEQEPSQPDLLGAKKVLRRIISSGSVFRFPLIKTKCPHCSEVTNFVLTEKVAYIAKVWGLGFGRLSEHLIMCDDCGYMEFVQKEDYWKWKSLGEAFRKLETNAISEEEFAVIVDKLDLNEIKRILGEAATWTCECGESNPPNFSQCWKCGAASVKVTTESLNKPLETGEWHPWKP
jgi:phage FluMu protein Com